MTVSSWHQGERLNLLIEQPNKPARLAEQMLRIEEGVSQIYTDCAYGPVSQQLGA